MSHQSRERRRAVGLALPLLLFIVVTFVAPLAAMLVRSIHDPAVVDALPETISALEGWDGQGLPPEEAFAAMARELVDARADRSLGKVASALNRV
ncbi:MAG: ABC transporter permease, partial [Gemmatimonadetes bacterium]|nr:ABC transporter permease [Gemmatimonadota bacterium]